MKKNTKIILWIALAILAITIVALVYVASEMVTVMRSEVPEAVVENSVSSEPESQRQPKNAVVDFATLPEGFELEVFADGLGSSAIASPGPNNGPRMMMERSGAVYTSLMKQGIVQVLHDSDGDAYVEKQSIFIEGLNNPHGLEQLDDWVYIAEEDRVIRVRDTDFDHVPEIDTLEVLLELPEGFGHFTRTIRIIDGKLYVATGSSCNVCEESNPVRATIQECSLDGSNCSVFAEGLRNTVDFIEYEGQIFGTDNGRDAIGNDIPPDEVNIIEKGKHYGWPACYGKQVRDETYQSSFDCADSEPSFANLPAHVAPLGIGAYTGAIFPEKFQNKLYVGYHGSWNRTPPSGYEVAYVDPETGEVTPFITGFLDEGKVLGRPVGVIQYQDALLLSDDNAGRIYRVVYTRE